MSVLWNIVPRSYNMWVFRHASFIPIAKTLCSGSSAISPGGKHIVASNLFDGLDFYSTADRTLSHSVPCPINQQKNAAVPVLFTGDGSAIIVGGTSGSVRVLDSSSCETLQVLSHDGRFSMFLGVPELIIYTGDLIQTMVRLSYGERIPLLTFDRQDSCTTWDGKQMIAAGVSERGDDTVIKVWVSQPPPAPQPLPPAQESTPVDVRIPRFTQA
jgi:hypothetical protein